MGWPEKDEGDFGNEFFSNWKTAEVSRLEFCNVNLLLI